MAQRQIRPRHPARMGTEGDGPRLGGAPTVRHRRAGERGLDAIDERLGERRRADGHPPDRRAIGGGERGRLLEHQRQHGRDPGQPGAAMAPDRLDEGARGEARQHDDARPARKRHDTGDPQRVHVVERRGDEEPLVRQVRRRLQPLLGRPQRAVVGQRHALGQARRTGRVEDHRDLARLGRDGRKRPGAHEGVESRVELHDGGAGGYRGPALGIDEHERDAGVAQHVLDRRRRQLEVDRHRHHPRSHRPEKGRQVLGAIGREDGDAVATLGAVSHQAACHGRRRAIEGVVAPLARFRRIAEVDQRDPLGRGRAGHHVAEVARAHHRAAVGVSVVVL